MSLKFCTDISEEAIRALYAKNNRPKVSTNATENQYQEPSWYMQTKKNEYVTSLTDAQ